MRFALKVLGLTVLLTVASWFLLAKRTSEDFEPQSPDPPQLQLPPEIHRGNPPTREFPKTQLSCSFDLKYGVPEVALLWSTLARHKFASLGEEGSQVFSTDYWPNTGLWLSGSVLIVAGVTPETGHTMLERWTFEASPEVPRAEWVGGEATLAWILPDRLLVERIYEGDEPGARHVQSLIENRGRPGTLFASFRDSNSLYSLAEGRLEIEPWGKAPNSEPLSFLSVEKGENGGFLYTLFFGPTDLYCGSELGNGGLLTVSDEEGDGSLDPAP